MKTYEEFLQKYLKEIQFEEAFNQQQLQELQDIFANALQIAAIVTDIDGKPITKPSNFSRLCNRVRKTETGMNYCMYSDACKKRPADETAGEITPGSALIKCTSLGLCNAEIPIMVGEKHVANWLFGQVRNEAEAANQLQICERAEKIGIDAEEFMEAFMEVPAISKERFETIIKLMEKLCGLLSEQAKQVCVKKAEEEYRQILSDELTYQKELAEYSSNIDELTQLHNRNYFEKQVEKLDFAGITPVAIVIGDVNHLKLTNDIFGHRYGDYLLKTIAKVMKDEAFDGYIICRCGGDEFNVLIPRANRQEAEWYCKRVRIELQKRFDCCFMPSISFGVGKKSNKQERIKDIMEFADYKMYCNKMMIKEKENLLFDVQNVLLGRGFLTPEYQENTIYMARRFGQYLNFAEAEVKRFTRLVRVQDYGMVTITKKLFAERFQPDLSIEKVREILKHPGITSKLVGLDQNYCEVADLALAHEECWDGSGYPNELKGEEIPLLSRLSKLIGDYNLLIASPPIGHGLPKEAAEREIAAGSASRYDPVYTQKFLDFLKQDQ